MARTAALPIMTAEGGLTRYLEEIRRFPMLEPQEEFMLAKSWREHGDREAAHRLVTSHLRLVAKIAMGYRGYGLPISEVISEGNVGLMQAVKRFEPDKGFRLATYGPGFKTKAARLPEAARQALEGLGRQALHAYLLAVQHPKSGEKLEFRSELPADLVRLHRSLAAG